MRTILLVEDERDLLEAMATTLMRRGFEVFTSADAIEAEEFLSRGLPDLLIADVMLPGASGFSIAELVVERSEGQVPVLMMSPACSVSPSRVFRSPAMAATIR